MILVTGASGNIGREVLKETEATGTRIRAAYQDASNADAPPGVEVATVDFNQPETLKAALQGVDRVFLVGPPTAQLALLEQKAVDVVRHAGIKQLVKLSAMGGRAATFPRQHAESEDYIRSTGIPYTFLRPNGFMHINRVGARAVSFRSSIAHPAYSPVYASPCTSRCPAQNSGPSGSLVLAREDSSSSASCRFSPAH